MVSTEPLDGPASLKLTTRLVPLSDALVAFLMKWALPLAANPVLAAVTTAAPIDAASATVERTWILRMNWFSAFDHRQCQWAGPLWPRRHHTATDSDGRG